VHKGHLAVEPIRARPFRAAREHEAAKRDRAIAAGHDIHRHDPRVETRRADLDHRAEVISR